MRASSRILAGAGLAVTAIYAPTGAWACSAASGNTAVIHNAIPADPDPRLIIARVDIEWADEELLHERGLTARVTRVIHGDIDGDVIIVWSPWTSCSHAFENGRSGLIFGLPLGTENGMLVVEAFEISRTSGYRIPDGYRIPESYLETVRARGAALRSAANKRRP